MSNPVIYSAQSTEHARQTALALQQALTAEKQRPARMEAAKPAQQEHQTATKTRQQEQTDAKQTRSQTAQTAEAAQQTAAAENTAAMENALQFQHAVQQAIARHKNAKKRLARTEHALTLIHPMEQHALEENARMENAPSHAFQKHALNLAKNAESGTMAAQTMPTAENAMTEKNAILPENAPKSRIPK